MQYDPYNQQPTNPYDQLNPGGQPQYPQQPLYEEPRWPESGNRIVVEELFLVPSGTYQDQWRRPFTVPKESQAAKNAIYDTVGQAYRDFVAKQESGQVS